MILLVIQINKILLQEDDKLAFTFFLTESESSYSICTYGLKYKKSTDKIILEE